MRLQHAKLAALYIPNITGWLGTVENGLEMLSDALCADPYKIVFVVATCEDKDDGAVPYFFEGAEGNIGSRLGYRRVITCLPPLAVS